MKVWNRQASRADPARFRDEVLPLLAGVPIVELAVATGLTRDYVRRIVAGTVTPHERHWNALLSVAREDTRGSNGTSRGGAVTARSSV